MDQDSIQMVAASKVPMLKPENGNAPPITKVVEGVETTIVPTTARKGTKVQAVEKRFGGNAATKKTQRNLLKQYTSNINRAVNTAHGATTASTQAIVVNSTTIENLSDAVICAFFAS
ncbi:hypothetical protein Tco_0132788 [Tanacetum coccineum]